MSLQSNSGTNLFKINAEVEKKRSSKISENKGGRSRKERNQCSHLIHTLLEKQHDHQKAQRRQSTRKTPPETHSDERELENLENCERTSRVYLSRKYIWTRKNHHGKRLRKLDRDLHQDQMEYTRKDTVKIGKEEGKCNIMLAASRGLFYLKRENVRINHQFRTISLL